MAGREAARCGTVLLLGLLLVLPVPAAAQTAPAPTVPVPAVPPTPPPPPPPPAAFRLPMDAGPKLLAQRDQARADLVRLAPELQAANDRRDELQLRWEGLTAHLVELGALAQRTANELRAARERVRVSAARAYVQSGTGRMAATLRAVSDAGDALEVNRDLHLITKYGEHEIDVVAELEREKLALDAQIYDVAQERADVRAQLDQAIVTAAALQAAFDDARRRLEEAEAGLARFHELAATAGSPIRGPNRLSAQQLADFVRASGNQPHITVTIDELAQYYLEESEKVGIRGDVAWAQSILETGYFGFAGSMVEPEDNNFAGIGACDSCTRGFRFPDARTGVRAQMQLLRVYTDRSVERDSLPDPLLLPGTLKLGFRGRVQSWWDLTGTWATANDYGIRVYDLYLRMVAETAPPDDVTAPAG